MGAPMRILILASAVCLMMAPVDPHRASPVFAGDGLSTPDDRQDVVTVPRGQVINRDYFAAADRVEIYGTINGDAHIVARQITVDGTVNGDLLSAGALISISGTVTANARLVGGHITVNGRVGRNLTVGGGYIDVLPSARIEGGLIAGGGSVQVGASVGRYVNVGGGEVTLAGEIEGPVNAAAGTLRLTSNARINGPLRYLGEEPPSIDESAVVTGGVTQRPFRNLRLPDRERLFLGIAAIKLLLLAMSLVSTLILGLLVIRFYPVATEQTLEHLSCRTLSAFGLGTMVAILAPVTLLVLGITIVAIPLAILAAALLLVFLYAGRIMSIAWIGRGVLRRFGREPRLTGAFLTGLVVYYLVSLVPLVGGVFAVLAVLFGVGALLATKIHIYQTARGRDLI